MKRYSFILFLGLGYGVFSQGIQDTLINGLLDRETLDFIKQTGITVKAGSQLMQPVQQVRNLIMEETRKLYDLHKPIYKGFFSFENITYQGDTSSIYGGDVIFSNVQGSFGVDIMGLPVSVSGNAAFEGSRFNSKFSSFALSLDTERLLQKYRQKSLFGDYKKAKDKLLNHDIVEIKPEEAEAMLKEQKFEVYRQIVTHPKFIKIRKELEQRRDSLLESMPDSLTSKFQENDELRSIIDIEKTFQRLWSERKASYEILQVYRKRTEDLQNRIKEIADPEALKKDLLTKAEEQGEFKNRLFLATKALDFGLTTIDDREFTIRNFPVNGFRYEYDDTKYNGSIAYGYQNLTPYASFFTDNSFLNRFNESRLLFTRAGFNKSDGGTIQISYLNAKKTNSSADSIFTFPNYNSVIGAMASQPLGKAAEVVIDFAFSNQDFVPGQKDEDFPVKQQNLAFSVQARQAFRDSTLQIGAGYFHVGPSFYTMGNPFLMTNRKGLSLDIQTSLFDKKLQLRSSLKYGFSSFDPGYNTIEASDWQIVGEGRLKLGKKNFLSATVMPNTNIRRLTNENLKASNNIYSLAGNFMFDFKNLAYNLSACFTNLNSSFDYADTLLQRDLNYFFLNQSLVFSQTRQLNLICMVGGENLVQGTISDLTAEIKYNHQFTTFSTSWGGQWVKYKWDPRDKIGLVGGFQYSFLKNCQLLLNASFRRAIERSHTDKDYELYLNTLFKITIF